jgi:hypothetical protein
MNWLDKMDAVLKCAYDKSGKNPTMKMYIDWIKERHGSEIDKGEVEDIILYLHREAMIYCDVGGDRNHAYKEGEDIKYPISCKGKLFWEGVGGFHKQEINRVAQNTQAETLKQFQKVNANRMTYLTIAISVGTIVAGVYYFLGVYDTHPKVAYYLSGVITTILVITIVGLAFLKRKKPK